MTDDPQFDFKALPKWQQYAIALVVLVVVVAAAWLTGRDDPIPAWIPRLLVPVLSVLFLVAMILGVIDWWRRRG